MVTHTKNNAFTLIELLVVISIIALLIGILLPVLGGARDAGRLSKCLSNHRQFGIAFAAYATENRDAMPFHSFWYNHAGKSGDFEAFGLSGPADWERAIGETGIRDEAGTLTERVLNDYLGQNADVSQCPSDVGDAKQPGVTSAFDAYGVSYQVQWNEDGLNTPYGVVPVTGKAQVQPTGDRLLSNLRKSARWGEPIKYNGKTYSGSWSNKIIQGDFNWHGNRPITDPRVLWHRPGNKNVRQQSMLFGDGHGSFFIFPDHYGSYTLPVDESGNGYW